MDLQNGEVRLLLHALGCHFFPLLPFANSLEKPPATLPQNRYFRRRKNLHPDLPKRSDPPMRHAFERSYDLAILDRASYGSS